MTTSNNIKYKVMKEGKNYKIVCLEPDHTFFLDPYPQYRMITILKGMIRVHYDPVLYFLQQEQSLIFRTEQNVNLETDQDTVYVEIQLEADHLNREAFTKGNHFRLKDLLGYEMGQIKEIVVAENENLQLQVLSYGHGTGLNEQAAKTEKVVFGLEGRAVIGYKKKEYELKAGDIFLIEKKASYFIHAIEKFKMAQIKVLN